MIDNIDLDELERRAPHETTCSAFGLLVRRLCSEYRKMRSERDIYRVTLETIHRKMDLVNDCVEGCRCIGCDAWRALHPLEGK